MTENGEFADRTGASAEPSSDRGEGKPLAAFLAMVTVVPALGLVSVVATQMRDWSERLHTAGFVFAAVLGVVQLAYVLHALRNSKLDTEKKALWVLLIIAAHLLGMALYWWAYIWPRRRCRGRTP